MEMWESEFFCDGGCGREAKLSSPREGEDIADILRRAGWRFLTKEEAYCPSCQAKIPKLAKRLKEG